MPLPQIPLDDPRVLALAKARQQLAHEGALCPTWEELTMAAPSTRPFPASPYSGL
ncbi:hypothetical protein ABT061_24940 [Streptosporangium sp. NPDC002544]|uniref:hypothetical protein n=1 Tax=Streptosporangium sp. NPDC002544 TaxID=3154538 RepID=UPI00332DA823